MPKLIAATVCAASLVTATWLGVAAASPLNSDVSRRARLSVSVSDPRRTIPASPGSYHCFPQPAGRDAVCSDAFYPLRLFGSVVFVPRRALVIKLGLRARSVRLSFGDRGGRSSADPPARLGGVERAAARGRPVGRRWRVTLPARMPARASRIVIDVVHYDGNAGDFEIGVRRRSYRRR